MEIFKRTIRTFNPNELKNKITQENIFRVNELGEVSELEIDKYNEIENKLKTFNIQFFLTQNIKDMGVYNDIEKKNR